MLYKSPPFAVLSATIAVALALGLSACGGETEASSEAMVSPPVSPTPTASPSPTDPAAAAKEKNVADAELRYSEFRDISDRYAKKGESPFWELMNNGYLGNADIQASQQSFWDQFTELKLKQTGQASVASVEVTDYEGDPLDESVQGHRVHLIICTDNSGKDVVRPNGTSALKKGDSRRIEMGVVMQGQSSGVWSVVETASTGKDC
ncbi:hypothetical protein [Promicromonospora sp. NPDC023987]|uniref:hypothetical protein n=1 Tax=Promicromonospora sp. NPDC023987 TaxID=3155360 RepID=UPI0033DD27E3